MRNKCKARSGSERAVILNILFTVYLAVASHEHAQLSDVISRYLFVTHTGWAGGCRKLFRDVSRVYSPRQLRNAYFGEWNRFYGQLEMLEARSRLMIVNDEMIMKHQATFVTVLS